jgi:hypothetical protein
MAGLSGLYLDEIEFVLDSIPEGTKITITKGPKRDGDSIFHVDITNRALRDQLEGKLHRDYIDEEDSFEEGIDDFQMR